MKIQYVNGDLFSTECKCILHGCNAQGVMGSGIAKIIREKYPEAYQEYRKATLAGSLELGKVIPAESNGKIILSAITQKYYGRDKKRYVSYDAVADVMKIVQQVAPSHVAMPQIGSGLGGGDWNVIESIIESELTTVIPVVYVFNG